MQIPQKKVILIVGNKYVFDDNLDLSESHAHALDHIAKHNDVFLSVKVESDEEEKKVIELCKKHVPHLKESQILCFEQSSSVYSMSRQLNPDIVFHVEQNTFDQLNKFIESHIIDKPIDKFFH